MAVPHIREVTEHFQEFPAACSILLFDGHFVMPVSRYVHFVHGGNLVLFLYMFVSDHRTLVDGGERDGIIGSSVEEVETPGE